MEKAIGLVKRWASNRLASSALGYTAAIVVSRLPAFFFLPLYAAHLPPSALGHYLTALILADLVQTLSASGMGQALFRFFPQAEGEGSRRALVGTALCTGIGCAAAVCCVFAFAYLWPVTRSSLEAFRSLPVGCFALALAAGSGIGLTSILNSILWAEGRPRAFIIALSAGAVAETALAGSMVALKAVNLERMLAVECIKDVAVLLISAWCGRRHLSFRFDPARFRALVRFGAWFTPMGLFSWTLLSTDRFWLGQESSMVEVGIFGFFYKFASPATVLFQSYLISLDRGVFRAKADEASALLREALRRYLGWAGIMMVAASVALPAVAWLAIRSGALPGPYRAGLKVYPALLGVIYLYFWALHYSAWQDFHLRSLRQMVFMGCAASANFLLSPLAIGIGRKWGLDPLAAVAYADLASMAVLLSLHSRSAGTLGGNAWGKAVPWILSLSCVHILWRVVGG